MVGKLSPVLNLSVIAWPISAAINENRPTLTYTSSAKFGTKWMQQRRIQSRVTVALSEVATKCFLLWTQRLLAAAKVLAFSRSWPRGIMMLRRDHVPTPGCCLIPHILVLRITVPTE
jgi:hypothetical protein